jgi:cytochrome c oxidase subunit II
MDRSFRLFPDQASTIAPEVDSLYTFLVGVTCFFTLGIFLAIVFLAIYYRRSAVRDRRPAHAGNLWMLEAAWIVIPLLLTMVMFAWGAAVFVEMRAMPDDALELQVLGKQWMWKVQHPQGRSEINELHVPVGRPIRLRMISEDVIHSFFIPDFRVKQDVLPDRYSTLWFEATMPGEYYLFCAEYCGTDHADMSGRVVAMRPADYAEWLAGGEQQTPVTAGGELFTQFRCDTCHYQGGQPRCPPLEDLFGSEVRLADGSVIAVDEEYLRQSILDPTARIVAGYQPVMPTYEGQLSEEQIFHLIAYIKSLSAMPQETESREAIETAAPPEGESAQVGGVSDADFPEQPNALSASQTPPTLESEPATD